MCRGWPVSAARRRINPPAARNEALRAHVTRVGFDLSLARSHVAALVYLNESAERDEWVGTRQVIRGALYRAFSLWATGAEGLIRRGLIVHHYQSSERTGSPNPHYTITRAGELVIDLLREAGLYAEYATALNVGREGAA